MSEIEFWDNLAKRRIELKNNGVSRILEWEDDDPKALFLALVKDNASGAVVLDVGCAEGELCKETAGLAKRVVGIDLSQTAIDEAKISASANVEFVHGDAHRLPFSEDTFDLVCSMRGPGSASIEALIEIRRVLKPGGMLIALAIGEAHRIETQEIFGRGVHWPPVKCARFAIPERLESSGLKLDFFSESYGTSYCASLRDFTTQLSTTTIIPDFDPIRDAALLRQVDRMLKTDRGIRDTEHLAVFVAVKAG